MTHRDAITCENALLQRGGVDNKVFGARRPPFAAHSPRFCFPSLARTASVRRHLQMIALPVFVADEAGSYISSGHRRTLRKSHLEKGNERTAGDR